MLYAFQFLPRNSPWCVRCSWEKKICDGLVTNFYLFTLIPLLLPWLGLQPWWNVWEKKFGLQNEMLSFTSYRCLRYKQRLRRKSVNTAHKEWKKKEWMTLESCSCCCSIWDGEARDSMSRTTSQSITAYSLSWYFYSVTFSKVHLQIQARVWPMYFSLAKLFLYQV